MPKTIGCVKGWRWGVVRDRFDFATHYGRPTMPSIIRSIDDLNAALTQQRAAFHAMPHPMPRGGGNE